MEKQKQVLMQAKQFDQPEWAAAPQAPPLYGGQNMVQQPPPPIWGAPVTCQMSRQELQSLLERSEYGNNAMIFNSYFRPSMIPGGPPVCNNCNRPIAEHTAATTSAPTATMSSAATAVQIDPNALPTGMVRDGMIDRFESKFLMAFLYVGFLLLGLAVLMVLVFSVTMMVRKAPYVLMGPCILLLMFGIFSIFPEKITVTFDRSRREWHAQKTKIVWGCCNEEHQGRFDDVTGVGHEGTNVTVNHQPVMRVGLRVNGIDGLVPLQDAMLYELPTAEQSWNVYVESNIRRQF